MFEHFLKYMPFYFLSNTVLLLLEIFKNVLCELNLGLESSQTKCSVWQKKKTVFWNPFLNTINRFQKDTEFTNNFGDFASLILTHNSQLQH